MKYFPFFALAVVTSVHAASAQSPSLPSPAVASEQPAVKSPPEGGTTVVGDRESPIGLYITPWRNATPEAELDRPARFLEEEMLPLDPDVFRRQIEYYNTITDYVRTKSTPSPASVNRQ